MLACKDGNSVRVVEAVEDNGLDAIAVDLVKSRGTILTSNEHSNLALDEVRVGGLQKIMECSAPDKASRSSEEDTVR